MSNNLLQGRDVLMQFDIGGGFENFLCADTMALQVDTEMKEVSTIGDGAFRKYQPQKLGYSISLGGIIKMDDVDPTSFVLLNYQLQKLPVPFRMFFSDPDSSNIKVVSGNLWKTQTVLTGNQDEFASDSSSFIGDGALVVSDSFTGCTAVITSHTLTPGVTDSGDSLRVQLTVNVDTVRVDYRINALSTFSLFPTGGAIDQIIVAGIPSGSNTITLTPICANGEPGTPLVLSFTSA